MEDAAAAKAVYLVLGSLPVDELGASVTLEAACCSLGSGASMSFVGLLLSVMVSC